MSSSDLIRWGGIGAIVTGVMYAVRGGMIQLELIHVEGAVVPAYVVVSVVAAVVAQLGKLVAIAGLYTLLRGRYAWQYGTLGSLTAFVGTLFSLMHPGADPLEGNDFSVFSILALMLSFVGFLLLGYATMEARVLPRWCGVPFFLGVPFAPFLTPAFEGIGGPEIILGVVWALVGYGLFSSGDAPTQQSTLVS